MDKQLKPSKNKHSNVKVYVDNVEKRKMPRKIVVKINEGIVESHLIDLPFINYYKSKFPVYEITYYWYNPAGEKYQVQVKSSTLGVPSAYEFDIILALFRLYSKKNNEIMFNQNTGEFDNLDVKVEFTYRELAKEMGYKSFGKGIIDKIKKGIRTLLETTIYTSLSNLIVKDNWETYLSDEEIKEIEKQLDDNKKEEIKSLMLKKEIGFHIIDMIDEETIVGVRHHFKDKMVVRINKYFYEALKKGYFTKYDVNTYLSLRSDVAKKLYLILLKWCGNNVISKKYKLYTLYDRIPLPDTQENKYRKRKIKTALEELVNANFIKSFVIEGESEEETVTVFFKESSNVTEENLYCAKDKFTNIVEIINGLKEYGLTDKEIDEKFDIRQVEYIKALLRYCYIKSQYNQISNIREYILKGLPPNPPYSINEKFYDTLIKEEKITIQPEENKIEVENIYTGQEIFNKIMDYLKENEPTLYNNWFKYMEFYSAHNGNIYINVKTEFAKDIISIRYMPLLNEIMKKFNSEFNQIYIL